MIPRNSWIHADSCTVHLHAILLKVNQGVFKPDSFVAVNARKSNKTGIKYELWNSTLRATENSSIMFQIDGSPNNIIKSFICLVFPFMTVFPTFMSTEAWIAVGFSQL